jgi:phage terminase small subunit
MGNRKENKQGQDKAINARQEAFCQEYIVDLNQAAAAKRAGYTESRAHITGAELMADPRVQARIAELQRERTARTQITQDRVLQELARLAFFDIRKLLHPDGSAKLITELDDDTAAALAGMDIFEEFAGSGEERIQIGYTKKYKITDKKGSLELLMRHMGMLNDKLKLQGDAANPLVLLMQQLRGSAIKPVTNLTKDND